MSENLSLADRAVSALSAVSAIGEKSTTMDHPERHIVRQIKRHAEEVLKNAFIQAEALAYMATDLSDMTSKAIQEAISKHEA